MATFTQMAMPIFEKVIKDYHLTDDVDQQINNPYEMGTIEYYLTEVLDYLLLNNRQ